MHIEADADNSSETVLVRITGPDHPGVTAGLTSVLADAGAEVYDIEQIVIRDQLRSV